MIRLGQDKPTPQQLSSRFSQKGQTPEPDFIGASIILFLATPEAFANYHTECQKQSSIGKSIAC